jgi:hypothetical protein
MSYLTNLEMTDMRTYDRQPFKVGVVGYSDKKFNEVQALTYIKAAFNRIAAEYSEQHDIVIVSGYTALGIPLLAYQEAKNRGWKTKGIACEKAKEHEVFECDEVVIFGQDWGDESHIFLNDIDFLVRIGGGDQSMEETAGAYQKGLPVLEYNLLAEK